MWGAACTDGAVGSIFWVANADAEQPVADQPTSTPSSCAGAAWRSLKIPPVPQHTHRCLKTPAAIKLTGIDIIQRGGDGERAAAGVSAFGSSLGLGACRWGPVGGSCPGAQSPLRPASYQNPSGSMSGCQECPADAHQCAAHAWLGPSCTQKCAARQHWPGLGPLSQSVPDRKAASTAMLAWNKRRDFLDKTQQHRVSCRGDRGIPCRGKDICMGMDTMGRGPIAG